MQADQVSFTKTKNIMKRNIVLHRKLEGNLHLLCESYSFP